MENSLSEHNWDSDIKPLVSIGCITYNHENYIRDAIEGFLRQKTTFPVEIIIHDDASTDRTAEIIREYSEKYPKLFKTILQKENQWSKGNGSIYAQFVFPKAQGKYIAMCEGDDYWTDVKKLSKQIEVLQANSDIVLVSHGAYKYNSIKNENVGSISISDAEGIIDTSKIITREDGYIPTASMLFESKMIKNIPGWVNSIPVLDYYLSLIALKYGSVYNINEFMCVRRIVEQSWTTRVKNNSWYINHHMAHLNSIKSYDKYTNGKFSVDLKKIVNTKTKEMLFGIIKNGILQKYKKEDFNYLIKQFQYLKIVDYFSIIKKIAITFIK